MHALKRQACAPRSLTGATRNNRCRKRFDEKMGIADMDFKNHSPAAKRASRTAVPSRTRAAASVPALVPQTANTAHDREHF
ncbi:hypothetical protein [Paraburkholderia sp. SUR17]|uniref:hypothetical protein n=1 Tax=Paraburkholderia sp. SUR17 TaxID=3034358 RepID=UPI002407EEBF|nr:hypothetical protein [Paraburkholderia sp. SUR17]WEY39966.1 hypothetical protein P2869_06305 [Paraburkholderia sp. SUR17]